MGLMDFFKKGTEKPASPQPQSRSTIPGEQPPTVQNPLASAQRDYVVQSGDSLSKIARQFYGNANEWQKIYQANKDAIKNPDLIYPGQKIIIP